MAMFPDPRAIDLYRVLRDAGVNVVLAGGACRDFLFGRETKDYDFLVLGKDWMNSLTLDTLRGSLPDEGTFSSVIQQSYSTNMRCGDVWEFLYQGLLVNIIFPNLDGEGAWNTPQEVVDHFDTSINVAYYDFHTGKMVVDPRHSFLTGKVEFISDPKVIGIDRVLKRYDRLQPKFPELDWSAVVKFLNNPNYLAPWS